VEGIPTVRRQRIEGDGKLTRGHPVAWIAISAVERLVERWIDRLAL
jgi:hypothetical protein